MVFIFYIAGLCAKYWVPRESQNYFVQSIGCQAKALCSLPLFPSLVLLLSQVRTAACAVKNKRQKRFSGHALDSKSALLESSKGRAVQHILLPSFSSQTCHAGKQKCSAGKFPGALSSTSCYLDFIPDMSCWKAAVLCRKVPRGTVQHILLPAKYSAGKLTPLSLYNN